MSSRRTQSLTSGGEKPKPLGKLEAGAQGLFGRKIVLDREIDTPAVYARSGSLLETLPLDGAVDVASDGRGQIYVLTTKPSRVSVFGPDHRLRRAFSTSVDRPVALDVDQLGNIYLLDTGRKAVEVTDAFLIAKNGELAGRGV